MRFILVLVVFLSSTGSSLAQVKGFGMQVQLSYSLGSPINRLGIQTQFYGAYDFFQLNTGFSSHLYLSGLGPKGIFFENRAHLSGVLAWGQRDFRSNFTWFNPVFHQLERRYSLGYSYYFYWDNRGSSQRSGAWGLQLNQALVYFENDLFAGQGRDRFRTGKLQLVYIDSVQIASMNIKIWTGETRGAKLVDDIYGNTKKGYRDLSETKFGRFSNGIFSVSYHRVYELTSFGLELGIDDERIRHVFQNRLIHGLPYKKQEQRVINRNLPMLDSNGLPYLDKENQTLRRRKLVMMVGSF